MTLILSKTDEGLVITQTVTYTRVLHHPNNYKAFAADVLKYSSGGAKVENRLPKPDRQIIEQELNNLRRSLK